MSPLQLTLIALWLAGIVPATLVFARLFERRDVTDEGAGLLGVFWPIMMIGLAIFWAVRGLANLAAKARGEAL